MARTIEERAKIIISEIEKLKGSYNLPLHHNIESVKTRFENFYLDMIEIINPDDLLYDRRKKDGG